MNSRLFTRSALGILLLALALSVAAGVRANGQAGASVRGTVSQAGKPLRSVWVIVSQGGAERGRSLTGDDGRYYIGGLNGGGLPDRRGAAGATEVQGRDQAARQQQTRHHGSLSRRLRRAADSRPPACALAIRLL